MNKFDVNCPSSHTSNTDMSTDAASDSYAGYQLYHTMENKRKALSPTPPRPAFAELNIPIQLANRQTATTYDESVEEEEEVEEVEEDRSDSIESSDSSLSIEELAYDFLNVALEAPSASKPLSEKKKTKPAVSAKTALSAEFSAANDWVVQWRKTLSSSYKPRAFPAQLRAYALWHELKQSISTAAAILRDPPLKVSTVSAYVLEALRREKLPFDKERVREVVQHLPESSRARYGTFLKKNGIEISEC